GYSDYGVQLIDLPGYGPVPVFWDATFNRYRIRLINATANFIRALPTTVSRNVVAVMAQPFGARTNDWNVPHTQDQINAWLNAGYRVGASPGQPSVRMLNAAKTILNATAAAFPNKNIKLPFHVTAEALDGTKIALADAVLRYAYTRYPMRFHAQLN